MKCYGIIYKITNKINGKVYIGQTIQLFKARKKDHRNSMERLSHIYLYRAFKKYGLEAFEWEEIDQATSKVEPDEKERFYIEQFRSTNRKHGYNLTFGGEGGKQTEEVRQRIGASNKGRVKSEEERKKLSASLKGKYTKEKASWWGRKHTEEEKRKMSEAQRGPKNHMFGKKASEETRCKQGEARRGEKHWNHKRVINLDSGEVFISAMDASEKTGIDNSVIGKCCKGLRKSAGGFRWAYYTGGPNNSLKADGPSSNVTTHDAWPAPQQNLRSNFLDRSRQA
jgi:group I intron endonuclease